MNHRQAILRELHSTQPFSQIRLSLRCRLVQGNEAHDQFAITVTSTELPACVSGPRPVSVSVPPDVPPGSRSTIAWPPSSSVVGQSESHVSTLAYCPAVTSPSAQQKFHVTVWPSIVPVTQSCWQFAAALSHSIILAYLRIQQLQVTKSCMVQGGQVGRGSRAGVQEPVRTTRRRGGSWRGQGNTHWSASPHQSWLPIIVAPTAQTVTSAVAGGGGASGGGGGEGCGGGGDGEGGG